MSRPPAHREIARWRTDTPGCERLVHLNNAGASLAPASSGKQWMPTWISSSGSADEPLALRRASE